MEPTLASKATLLRQKLARYLAYAEDRAWEGVYPHCPPLLLLTTTATRAATFARTAADVLGKPVLSDDPAAGLVVAACGLVREPGRAVVEPCWVLPEAAAAELTLAEILAERVDALDTSERWHRHQETVVRRRADIEALRDVCSFSALADWFDSKLAAEALQALIGSEPAAFLDSEPELARQVIDWAERRRRVDRFTARDRARLLVSTGLPPRRASDIDRTDAGAQLSPRAAGQSDSGQKIADFLDVRVVRPALGD